MEKGDTKRQTPALLYRGVVLMSDEQQNTSSSPAKSEVNDTGKSGRSSEPRRSERTGPLSRAHDIDSASHLLIAVEATAYSLLFTAPNSQSRLLSIIIDFIIIDFIIIPLYSAPIAWHYG